MKKRDVYYWFYIALFILLGSWSIYYVVVQSYSLGWALFFIFSWAGLVQCGFYIRSNLIAFFQSGVRWVCKGGKRERVKRLSSLVPVKIDEAFVSIRDVNALEGWTGALQLEMVLPIATLVRGFTQRNSLSANELRYIREFFQNSFYGKQVYWSRIEGIIYNHQIEHANFENALQALNKLTIGQVQIRRGIYSLLMKITLHMEMKPTMIQNKNLRRAKWVLETPNLSPDILMSS